MHFIDRGIRWSLAPAAAIAIMVGSTATHASPDKNDTCLMCHEHEGDVLVFDDGTERSVAFDLDHWSESPHAGIVSCTDCHAGIEDYPHPSINLASARAYSRERSDSCRSCHYSYYTRMLDGIHYAVLEAGDDSAPTCVDCHGHHDIREAGRPREAIARRCGACHQDVATVYAQSAHGRGISGENTTDYPTCTDCHGAHAIQDPRGHAFRASGHEICAPCHADAGKMARYDLNPNVVQTYLDDFHGRSNLIYKAGGGVPREQMANCADCHGYHDVQSFRDDGGLTHVRERVAATCRKCHVDATPAFGDSWLSHYEPSLSNAPLVWAVKWGYRILIPFIIFALVLHILLHLWRVRMHRWEPGTPPGDKQ